MGIEKYTIHHGNDGMRDRDRDRDRERDRERAGAISASDFNTRSELSFDSIEGEAEHRAMDTGMVLEQGPPSAPSQLVCRICTLGIPGTGMATEELALEDRPQSWVAVEEERRISAMTRCSSPGWRICRRRAPR